MVSAPISYPTRSQNGPRPINLRKDIPQVLALLNAAFGPTLDAEGRHTLDRMSLAQQPWIVLQLRKMMDGMVPGFVWQESGKVIGNVSVLTTSVKGRYLVANVAVHPDYRRRGIARMLMEEVIDLVEARGGRQILLQVKDDNLAAIRLYEGLHFDEIGRITSWYASHSQLRLLPMAASARSPDRVGDLFIRPLRGSEWRTAWRLDQRSIAPDLNWPEPLPENAYKKSVWRWLENLLTGRQSESWIAEEEQGKMVGLATIGSEVGRVHNLTLRVHPAWRGQVERPLLAKLLRRLNYLARRSVRMDHPDDDRIASELLKEANFVPRRTLAVMRLNV
ncbi:MAG TPA: GNAT family N-acetyltransferase [Candidatus Sulfomarinibacteraceae bacterium]|nr:GNAT family N-acetyltransferase [Candidatus Sulfomarinibacteraceae bacterium]